MIENILTLAWGLKPKDNNNNKKKARLAKTEYIPIIYYFLS